MQQLILRGPRQLGWEEVDDPDPPIGAAAAVRPLAVATCDLDPLIVQGLWPMPYPLPFGHEFTAEVVEVGGDVTSVKPGMRVAVPFQISCGTCEFCVAGLTANCPVTPHRATYGFGEDGGSFGGALSDLVAIPFADHMLVPLPGGVDPGAAASVGDNMADGYSAVAPGLETWPGAEVLVVGGGGASIGLYAAGIAVALGASRSVYLDSDPDRLACAEQLGAEPLEGPPPRRVGLFQITVDTSGDPAGLACAVRSTGPSGVCTTPTGMLYRKVEVPVGWMYEHCCTLRSGRVHARPQMPALLDLIAAGRFRPEIVTSREVSFADAEEALLEPERKLLLVAARELDEDDS